VSAILGARLAYVLTEPGALHGGVVAFFNLRAGGLAFQGGLLFGVLAGMAYCRLAKVDPWAMAEIAPAPIALGYAFGRLGGCFMNGCCYGLPTKLPWGVVFPTVDALHRHPTQVYSSIGGLAIFAIITATRHHRMFRGFPMSLFVALYCVERFIVEIFRFRPLVWGPLGLAQILCIFGLVASILAIALLQRKRGHAATASPAARA
jgi:phosphatidylglycerol---prolipoprotein diacylglyceryl transferase